MNYLTNLHGYRLKLKLRSTSINPEFPLFLAIFWLPAMTNLSNLTKHCNGFVAHCIIGEVESDHQEHMPAFQYAARRNRCIHCTGTHASEDHHLSLAIPPVSNSGTIIVPPHQETKTTNEAISNTSDNYKIQGKPLPSQQSAFLHAQWTPPRPPTPPITSWPSMEGNNLQKSTATYPTSSTISRMSDSMLSPPSRQVHFMPTTANAM